MVAAPPRFADALQTGAITTGHVDALGNVLDHVEPGVAADVLADEAGLLEVARTVTRASFARYLTLRVDAVRTYEGQARLQQQIADSFAVLGDDDVGMAKLFVKLDPVRGQQVATAIRQRADVLQQSGDFHGQRRGQILAHAVHDLICGHTTAATGGAEILVIVDALSLLDGLHDGTISETDDGLPIPLDTIRQLAHQPGATITAAVTDPTGIVTAIGHHTPTPPAGSGRDDDTASPRRRSGRPDERADPGEPRPAAARDHDVGLRASGKGHGPRGEHGDGAVPHAPLEPGKDHDRSPTSADRPDTITEPPRCPTQRPPRAALRAAVAAAIDDATDRQLTMGRRVRLANRPQRRALRAMHRTCAHPGCHQRFADCFIHHITPWEHGGPTDLDTLVPLCGRHHHQIHDDHWTLTIDHERTLRWYRPNGTLHTTTPHQPLTATARAASTQVGGAESPGGDAPNASGTAAARPRAPASLDPRSSPPRAA